jgi:hypothetical protein
MGCRIRTIRETIDIKAARYATEMHASVEQMYGNFPYSKHLSDVATEIMLFKYLILKKDYPLVLAGAWCHDIIEDVHSVTYNDLKKVMGEEVADLAFACTESTGRDRAERHDVAYFDRIRAIPYADMIKIADWIANVSESIRTSSSMLKRYRKEYPEFRYLLYQERYKPMWEKLDVLCKD